MFVIHISYMCTVIVHLLFYQKFLLRREEAPADCGAQLVMFSSLSGCIWLPAIAHGNPN